MATLIIPEDTPLIELLRLAEATGKSLRHSSGQPAKPEDTPNGSNTRVTDRQPALRLAD
ncbi:conserved hypothetical protein [Marinobacter salarius]|uniref:hypothetical protein n=1 Tax=Marinobacter salarius TaxID=1420917 RepID=UPI001253A47A|nr:hypothetical protein [Marinobacter salarius]VVT02982.1 hypothetical protein MBHK15_110292 [Marinobacter salarius]VXC24383.1 conserved hypothetical protein [Marinobacter salarius]